MRTEELVHGIRRFNRFYTGIIGLLDETLTGSDYTLAEARVLFELAHRGEPNAAMIARELRLDPAYLARILRRFREAGLLRRAKAASDGRAHVLELTERGSAALAELQRAAERDVTKLVEGFSHDRRAALAQAMRTIESILGAVPPDSRTPAIRPHRIGDVGWVIQRQAVLYAEEYGWNGEFEAMLAEIGAAFIRDFSEGRDFCWIAELGGVPAGAVFLVHDPEDPSSAKLRMLHVEKFGRGNGVGRLLVDTCIAEARRCGYRHLKLWTNDILIDARKIYERCGFVLVEEERHHSFGRDLVGQYWALPL